MDKNQALNNLYQAARMAPLNAEAHELVRQSVVVLQQALEEKKEVQKIDEKA